MKSTSSQTRALEHELKKLVEGEVRFDAFSKILYSTDASIYQMEPVGVVIPRSKNDVLAVVDVARRAGVPILPRGGGTSLAGQTVNHAIVLDFSKYMDSLLEVNPDEGWALVQPGIVLDTLNGLLAPHGLKYAPDPSTSNRASVGGGIGNNSCGSHSVIYGKTSDHVLELNVVLADGSEARFSDLSSSALVRKLNGDGLEPNVYRSVLDIAGEHRDEINTRYPSIMRRVSGYNLDRFLNGGDVNLSQMLVGSEGTLGVITEAKINLVPTPNETALAIAHFARLDEACEATPAILEHSPDAVELVGEMLLERTRSSPSFSRRMNFVNGHPGAILVVEFSGDTPAEAADKAQKLKDALARRRLGYDCVTILDRAGQANVWAVRKAGLGLLMSVRGDAKPIPFVEDTAVSPEHLGQFVRRFDEIVGTHGTTAGYYGHASVGCLHIRPLVSLKTQEGLDTMTSIASEIADLVQEFGGSLSGEHGDGIVRGVWTEKMFGSKIYDAFRQVKQAFDPDGIMNPGKIIDTPPMTDNLRYGPGYKTLYFPTQLNFSADGGLDGAIDMCNGMGACRKPDGTMCPSYMVTREEEHSTRGRANLLRAAISGALPPQSIRSRRLYEALDLCLECKGCKGECPSNVDMAKLKYEFLYRYHGAHGTPLRAKLFANINRLNRLGSHFAPFANIASRTPGLRWMLHRFLGIHKDRPLPSFASQTFPDWFKSRTPRSNAPRGPVVLFNDTFMNYNVPSIGIAAVELLERAGFRVILANSRCCARPMISKGLLREAKASARYNVDILAPYATQNIPIVGCEPSCLLTLRDEYPDLLGDDKSKAVAANSYLIDEFLMNLYRKGELHLHFSDKGKKILFHGHCHQKALVGTDDAVNVLGLPPNYQVEEAKTGCCGMAGSFGFEKEHYDMSMAIGRQKLFPQVESKGEDWEIAVMGISCRQQVEHGTSHRPRHLVEVLRDAVV